MQVPERFKSIPEPLPDQLRTVAARWPEKPAIYYLDQIISYGELDRIVDHLARQILDRGTQRGDRILMALERRPAVVAAFLAISRAGAVAVPMNFRGSLEEIQAIRKLTDAAGIVYHSDLANQIGHPGPGEWVLEIPAQDDLAGNPTPGEFPQLTPEDPVYINFTSGSTGRPKGAVATHRNLFANTVDCCEAFQITAEDVHLPLFAVMSHPHEIFCRALLTGGSIVLVEKLYPRSIARAVTLFGVTCMMAVAPVYDLLVPFAANEQYDFSSLRLPESGGMVTPVWLNQRFQAAFGVPITPVWGSTESMGVALAPASGGDTPPDACGVPLSNISASIRDSDGNPVVPGDVGELWLKGPALAGQYWRSPDETRKHFSQGWYQTGDLFRMDDRGRYYYRGRTDNMIKVGGLKVYPAEIEAVLFAHSMIREAVVVPYHDRLRGVVPLAAVVLEPGEMMTEAQLRDYLKERLSVYKIPRVFRFMPYLPRTPGGKVDFRSIAAGGTPSAKSHGDSIETRIEAIDLKILHLLNERLRYVMDLRTAHGPAGFEPERIQETIQRLQEFNPGPLHDTFVEQIFRQILSISQYL